LLLLKSKSIKKNLNQRKREDQGKRLSTELKKKGVIFTIKRE
jgi:hypothetical protein